MRIEGFVIHLKRAVGRRPQVDELLRLLPVPTHVLDAVDGQTLTDAEVASVYRRGLHQPHYPFALRRGEIACFLSHRQAWREIVDRNLDAGLVLEDDVGLDPVLFKKALQLAETLCDGSPAYILFNFRKPGENAAVITADGSARIVRPQPVLLGAMAQLVSREAAKRLLEQSMMFDRPVDVFLQMYWQTSVCPLAADPAGTINCDADLGGTTLHAAKHPSETIWREWSRFIYRMKIRKLSRRHRDQVQL